MTNFERAETEILHERDAAKRYAFSQVECGAWDEETAADYLQERLLDLHKRWTELHDMLKEPITSEKA